jgi:hypothetical protein
MCSTFTGIGDVSPGFAGLLCGRHHEIVAVSLNQPRVSTSAPIPVSILLGNRAAFPAAPRDAVRSVLFTDLGWATPTITFQGVSVQRGITLDGMPAAFNKSGLALNPMIKDPEKAFFTLPTVKGRGSELLAWIGEHQRTSDCPTLKKVCGYGAESMRTLDPDEPTLSKAWGACLKTGIVISEQQWRFLSRKAP